jgi:hypothetical protein
MLLAVRENEKMSEANAQRSNESSSGEPGLQARQTEDGSYEFVVDDPTKRPEDPTPDVEETSDVATPPARPRRTHLLVGASVLAAALAVVASLALQGAGHDGSTGAQLDEEGGFVPYDDSGDEARGPERNATARAADERGEPHRARDVDETRPEDLPPENTTGELTGPPDGEAGWDLEEPIDEELAEEDVDESIEDRDAIVEVVPSDGPGDETSGEIDPDDADAPEREEFAEESGEEHVGGEDASAEPAPESAAVREDLRREMLERHLGGSRRDLIPRVVEMPQVDEVPRGVRLDRESPRLEEGARGDERAVPSPY